MALLGGMASKTSPNNADLIGDDTAPTGNETMNGESPMDGDGGDGDSGEDGGDDRNVLCTVLLNKDGTYTLVTGDEPEEGDDLVAPEGAGPAAGGTPAPPEGQTFDSPGPLLKAILDILRGSEGAGGDGGQADFEAGFNTKPDDQS